MLSVAIRAHISLPIPWQAFSSVVSFYLGTKSCKVIVFPFRKRLVLFSLSKEKEERRHTDSVQVSPTFCFALWHFTFTKDLHHQCLFSLPERNPKRSFAFTKQVKSKNSAPCLFGREIYGGPRHLHSKSGPARFLSQNHTQQLDIKLPELYTICVCALSRFILCIY